MMDYEERIVAVEPEQTKGPDKKTRKRPSLAVWHGLEYLMNRAVLLADGRLRTRLALRSPCSQKLLLDKVTIDAVTIKDFEEKKREMFSQLAQNHIDEIFDMIRSGQYQEAQFGLYWELRHDYVRVKQKWAGKAEVHDALWHDVLKRRFETIPIRELAFFERTKREMDVIFNHAGHRKLSEDEQLCWIQLSGFFDALVEDGIFPENPVKEYAARYKHSMSEDLLKNLSARSLSREELLAYVKACMAFKDSSRRTCMLIHVLTGLTVYELCGLNLNSWVRSEGLSWLEIEREYYQVRGKQAVLKEMLESANQYRKVVCSDVVEWLLANHVKQRKVEGAKKTDPLFVRDGDRLSPAILKKEEKTLLDEVMIRGMHIAYDGRGRPHREGRDRARTDILRGTAVYNYYYTAKMTRAQIALMCGVDRLHTYAIWYVDWNNMEVMRYMKQVISLWHNELFHVTKKDAVSEDCVWTQPGERRGICLYGNAKPGAVIELKAPCGVDGVLQETSKNSDDEENPDA